MRRARAALLLAALQVLALAGADGPHESPRVPVPLANSSANLTEPVSSNSTSRSSETSSTAKPLTPIASSVSVSVTAGPTKSTATSKMATPGVSTSAAPTTSKSTPKATSMSQNTSRVPVPAATTTHGSLVTSPTITTAVHSQESGGSRFDPGSFVGGIVLTLGVLSVLYIGCKMYYSRRGIRYRTIDEHDAII
ncbi:PREDICTED: porimin [Chinchilla lanigera]|uniref:porimin n=1 Tax=Chinchilla lanigera TaxID=34839 RepID=UPI0006966F7C|nr:PREDICTED: porimin [Chinchilla lanigera]